MELTMGQRHSVFMLAKVTVLVCFREGWYGVTRNQWVNSFAPGKFGWNLWHIILKQILVIDDWGISCEIALIWMSLDFIDEQSTLVQVMAWLSQATSHYLSQCWPRSMLPYGVTRPQWCLSLWWFFFLLLNEDICWIVVSSRRMHACHECLISDNIFFASDFLLKICWSPKELRNGNVQELAKNQCQLFYRSVL